MCYCFGSVRFWLCDFLTPGFVTVKWYHNWYEHDFERPLNRRWIMEFTGARNWFTSGTINPGKRRCAHRWSHAQARRRPGLVWYLIRSSLRICYTSSLHLLRTLPKGYRYKVCNFVYVYYYQVDNRRSACTKFIGTSADNVFLRFYCFNLKRKCKTIL